VPSQIQVSHRERLEDCFVFAGHLKNIEYVPARVQADQKDRHLLAHLRFGFFRVAQITPPMGVNVFF
jgi:hypothetical protein